MVTKIAFVIRNLMANCELWYHHVCFFLEIYLYVLVKMAKHIVKNVLLYICYISINVFVEHGKMQCEKQGLLCRVKHLCFSSEQPIGKW